MVSFNGRAGELGRFGLVSTLVFALLFADAVGGLAYLSGVPWGVDFLPNWTAARALWHGGIPKPYDFAAITQDQTWLIARYTHSMWRGGHAVQLRPFVYPPSALALLAPFGLMGYWAALATWVAGAIALNATVAAGASRTVFGLVLALSLPVCVLSEICGQTSLLIAALVLIALSALDSRPIISGVLFALVGALKPQTVVLLPLALIAAGNWRAFVATALASLVLAAAAVALLGLSIWTQWLAALSEFSEVILGYPGFWKGLINPSGSALYLGLPVGAQYAIAMVGLIVAGVLVWFTFRRTADPMIRAVALLGGGILASPYALQYDAAMLAIPAVVLLMRAGTWTAWSAALAGYLALAAAVMPGDGAILVAVFVVAACWLNIRNVAAVAGASQAQALRA
jgi:alpha-1,2-mannosyltransferase